MRNTLLLCTLVCLIASFGQSLAQNPIQLKDADLRTGRIRWIPNYTNQATGEIGMQFSWSYYYKGRNAPDSLESRLLLYSTEQDSLFAQTDSILQLRNRRWARFEAFIPYRKIDLPADTHQLRLRYEVKGLVRMDTATTWIQPQRYLVTVKMEEGASVKEKLQYWDDGGPLEWSPDPYWRLRLGETGKILHRSPVAKNSFILPADSLTFYALEEEQPFVVEFWEEDPDRDTLLGVYEMPKVEGDVLQVFKGRMFGDMKLVSYSMSRKNLAPHPVSFSILPNYSYKERSGFRVNVLYELSDAYLGEEGKPNLVFKDKDGREMAIPGILPIDDSPPLNESMPLQARAQLEYFIPYYTWNDSAYTITFALTDRSGRNLTEIPNLIQVKGRAFILEKNFAYEERATYLGATGLRMRLKFNVKELPSYSPFEFRFYDEKRNPIKSRLYQVFDDTTYEEVAKPSNWQIRVEEQETFEFFIPYPDLKDNVILAEVDAVPDIKIPIIRGQTLQLNVPDSLQDVKIQLQEMKTDMEEFSFCQIFTYDLKVPRFYLERAKWKLQVYHNGSLFDDYYIISDCLELEDGALQAEEGSIRIAIPMRKLRANDKIELRHYVLDDKGYPLSEPTKTDWQAPEEIDLARLKFVPRRLRIKGKPEETVGYDLRIGTESIVRAVIPKPYKWRKNTNLRSEAIVHKKDRIILYTGMGTKRSSWGGDYHQLAQKRFKIKFKHRRHIVRKGVIKVEQLPLEDD